MELRPFPGAVRAAVLDGMAQFQVPGAAVGVVHEGQRYAEAFGVTNVRHPLPVTPQTLFQVGSTSKTFTATAVMQLVEAGAVELDATVRSYLPEFRLQSEDDAARVTVRDLLTHHGGFVGDLFENTGRGSDALARMVERLAGQAQVVPAGHAFSYSNAGFYTLGRIIEVVTGLGFERAIRGRLLRPLGLAMSYYFPEEAITHRVAAGHILTADGPEVASPWATPRSISPGGGLISNVLDQLSWATFHMGDGRAPGGEPVLARASLEQMQERQRPAGSICPWIGLSWMLSDLGGVRIVAHGGATNGQLSAFEFAPERGYACTVLTNSDSGRGLRPVVTEACREAFMGVKADPPIRSDGKLDLGSCTGTYTMVLATMRVTEEDGGLVVLEQPMQMDGRIAPLAPPATRLVITGPDTGAVVEGPRRGETCEFLRGDDGKVRFMRWDGRLATRQE
ncbi:MAG: serine hydrolase domain-containing protein [Dehalococcoidia bacterium]